MVDSVKICASKNPNERSQGSTKNHPEFGKSDFNNSKNLIELLWHRVEGRIKPLKTIFRIPHK